MMRHRGGEEEEEEEDSHYDGGVVAGAVEQTNCDISWQAPSDPGAVVCS